MELCDPVRSHKLSGVRGGDYLHWRSPRYAVVILTIQKMTPLWAGALFCSKRYLVFWCRQTAKMGVPGIHASSGFWLFWKPVLLSWIVSNMNNYTLLPSKMYSNLPCVLVSFYLCWRRDCACSITFSLMGEVIPLWICYALGLIESKWIQYRTNAKLSSEVYESVPPHDVPFFFSFYFISPFPSTK